MNDDARPPPALQVKKVLVLHDLHADSDNAAWRAGLLARAHGGWLRILNLARWGSPELAQARLDPLAWRLQEHLQVAVLAHAVRGSGSAELRRAGEDADLVVMRAPSGWDAATAVHPVRALQLTGRPTLVVRTPATVPYRRVLFAAGEDDAAERLAAAAHAMADGRETPTPVPLHSAAALLERERTLFPDLVALPCGRSRAVARRFLALTTADTLLLPPPSPEPLGPPVLADGTDIPLTGVA
jgi:hypothetical protein